MIAGVVLAAGFSRRLGRPKQEVEIGGEALLVRSTRTALAAGLSPVVAVVREMRWRAYLEPLGVSVLVNPEADEGMASSVRMGVREAAARGVAGLVLMTCDQPGITAEHLRGLYAEPERVTGSGYAGRVGVPAYFPASVFPELLALRGDAGARGLLRDAAAVVDETLALDVDTEADVEQARAQFDGRDAEV